MKRQRTITRARLCQLSFCNSKRLPRVVNIDGQRKEWVGIGWIDCGLARGDEVLVVEAKG